MGDVKYAYIVGDYAKGVDSGIIDLIIIGEIDQEILRQFIEKTEKLINRKIRSMLLTEKEFNKFKHTLPTNLNQIIKLSKYVRLKTQSLSVISPKP